MHFQQIDAAMTICRKHKSESQAAGLNSFEMKEIEHYLLRAMVLLIISHYEQYIEKLFIKRAEKAGDPEIRSMIAKFLGNKFRSPDLGKINDMLKALSMSCHANFQVQIQSKQPQVKASWDSLMTARHAIVHGANGAPISLTWTDLEKDYQQSTRVLQALANALGLTKSDMSRL